jgi:hypothetical protein
MTGVLLNGRSLRYFRIPDQPIIRTEAISDDSAD